MVNPPTSLGPYPITQEYLRSILSYDAETGVFTWTKPPWNHPRMAGQEAGSVATGYVMIKIDHRRYKAHRLAWLYVHGEWPSKRIDHRDGDTFNNAFANLRLATQAQNCANAGRWRGKKLPKGVRSVASGRFQARIRFDRKLRVIGTFCTAEEAAEAYLSEAQRLYGEFARAA